MKYILILIYIYYQFGFEIICKTRRLGISATEDIRDAATCEQGTHGTPSFVLWEQIAVV